MIKRYKKKPVVIEAIQYTRKNTEECVKFCGKDFICFNDNEILIKTLKGQYKASLGVITSSKVLKVRFIHVSLIYLK